MPVFSVSAHTNIVDNRFSYNAVVIARESAGWPAQYHYLADTLTYSTTPKYTTYPFMDYYTTFYQTNVDLTSGACQNNGECLAYMDTAYQTITVPSGSSSPYVLGSGTYTTFP